MRSENEKKGKDVERTRERERKEGKCVEYYSLFVEYVYTYTHIYNDKERMKAETAGCEKGRVIWKTCNAQQGAATEAKRRRTEDLMIGKKR